MENEKTRAEVLREQLLYKKKNAFETMDVSEVEKAGEYAVGYSEYLFHGKTEREAVSASVALLEQAGYVPYLLGDSVLPGGKYYLNNRGKALFAFRVGSENINSGVRITAAHIDSPRLDLKQHPLYEDDGLGYLKTHYYGGIRKYQWPTVPLALHGVVTKRGGENVEVCIGEDPGDPVFVITDLLPHLGYAQGAKPLDKAFAGEGLNLLIGATPYYNDDGKAYAGEDRIKLNMMRILNEKYGIVESDFMTAELCAVPAGRPMDIGLDRCLLGGYGHDDKVCAYPALTALIDSDDSAHTVICVLADKEETGSDGVTGMQGALLSDLIEALAEALGGNPAVVRSRSMCLSADVSAAFDPQYPEVFEKRNAAIINCGVTLSKYTGARDRKSVV